MRDVLSKHDIGAAGLGCEVRGEERSGELEECASIGSVLAFES